MNSKNSNKQSNPVDSSLRGGSWRKNGQWQGNANRTSTPVAYTNVDPTRAQSMPTKYENSNTDPEILKGKWRTVLDNNYKDAAGPENVSAISNFRGKVERGEVKHNSYNIIDSNLWKHVNEDTYLTLPENFKLKSSLKVYTDTREIKIASYGVERYNSPGGSMQKGISCENIPTYNIANHERFPIDFYKTLDDINIQLNDINKTIVCTESPLKAALREFEEETTLDIVPFLTRIFLTPISASAYYRPTGSIAPSSISDLVQYGSQGVTGKLIHNGVKYWNGTYKINYTLKLTDGQYMDLIHKLTDDHVIDNAKTRFEKESSVEVGGIHFKKYLKYKNKYMELKNKLLNNNGEQ